MPYDINGIVHCLEKHGSTALLQHLLKVFKHRAVLKSSRYNISTNIIVLASNI